MKYLAALTAAATILLTPGCLEEKVNPTLPPKLDSDARGMVVDYEPADTKPVICPQLPNKIKLILYNTTPARDHYF
mgnify:FL=1